MRSIPSCGKSSPRPGPSSALRKKWKSRSSPAPAERFYQVGFLNRIVPQADLIPTAMGMAEHLLSLPPASRVNTVHMMRQMRPEASDAQKALAAKLHDHGDKGDLIESRAAFSEKR